jgi:DNA-binding transcriptional LysR family regulator
MDSAYFREFVAVAYSGNFSEAAESLYISQSSLSKHIKKLEAELGTQLFTRTTRKVELNKFGHAFLPFAEQISATYADGFEMINSMLRVNTVNIGSVPTMAQYDITDMIYQFSRNNKGFNMNITEADSIELAGRLNNGSVELAFMRETDEFNPAFERITLADDYLVAVLPATHRLSRRESVSLSDLSGEDLVMIERSSMQYALCERKYRELGLEMNVLFSGHNIGNLADFIIKGLAVALLMNGQTRFIHVSPLKIVAIEPLIITHINLCWLKGKQLSPAAKHLINSAKYCLKK